MRSGDCGRAGQGPPPPRNPGPRAAHPVTHRRWGLRREEAEEAEEVPPLRGDPRAQPEVPPLSPQLPTSPAPPARKRKSRPFPRSAGVEDGGGGTGKGNYAGARHGVGWGDGQGRFRWADGA